MSDRAAEHTAVPHTPTPWKVVAVPEEPNNGDHTGCDAHVLVTDDAGRQIIDADDSHGCCAYPGKTWPVVSQADAEFIVECVNAHDSLLAANARLEDERKQIMKRLHIFETDGVYEIPAEPGPIETDSFPEAISKYADMMEREADKADATLAANARLREALEAVLPYLPSENDAREYAATNDGRASGEHVAAMKVRAALATPKEGK